MAIVTYILIGLYAFLTGLAGIKQWKDVGYHVRALLFVIISTGIILILFIPNKDLLFILLIFLFILLHILTIIQGKVTNGRIKYGHHIIRFIFHSIILLMVYKFIK
ncbi:hypothetical protein [Solibacillus daqui]|uniref:hypothetical protein n=1 Tax=Solibacillus daqui TaxID=2912187 RepID=UPI0023661A7F|nr:hypothetical protein [Solibacillus daqui]